MDKPDSTNANMSNGQIIVVETVTWQECYDGLSAVDHCLVGGRKIPGGSAGGGRVAIDDLGRWPVELMAAVNGTFDKGIDSGVGCFPSL